ncbi:MAG: mitochondrial fission ELM1 family protein [Alphaproteobacteria bacterium]|jgi:mitochondrial fission protein ELM1|nr:mitochondrial fission ELM1 family protein [Alphaproteobacteria bacterium]
MDSKVNAWILADHGKIGTYSQCLGIAQALGLTPKFKSMKPRMPWRVLPPQLCFGAIYSQTQGHDPLSPPWPDVLIAGGRVSAAPALAIKKRNKKCFTIILQKPYISPKHFDCVIVPYHDHVKGKNVISVLGALHRLNDAEIRSAAEVYTHPEISPLTTVLLGGDNRHYKYQEADIKALAEALKKIGGHTFITPSRRTSPHLLQMLKDNLMGHSYEIWDSVGENPYPAYLGLADQIIVTQDSISMASEACYTGKPVYIWEANHTSPKFREFHNDLYDQGYAKPFQYPFPQWTPKKLDEMGRVVAIIKKKLGWSKTTNDKEV